MQSSWVSCKGTAAAQLPGSTCCCHGGTSAQRGICVCVCARLPVCASWLQEVTRLWLKAVTPVLRMRNSRMWGSTGVVMADSASTSHSHACLSYSSLCSKLPITSHLLAKLKKCIRTISALPKQNKISEFASLSWLFLLWFLQAEHHSRFILHETSTFLKNSSTGAKIKTFNSVSPYSSLPLPLFRKRLCPQLSKNPYPTANMESLWLRPTWP